ncbi:hypothetical protein, partial [Microcella sp.]|uniref:hypothetical protein n=1 Tax=Microcella sp. TaxID=1913979 RepID=UPI003F702DC7
MIRHRPFGSGHPYSVDTEQRSPVDPVAGEPLTLGVRVTPEVDAVALQWDDGASITELALDRTERRSRGQAVDGGHLASAQARLARAARGFAVTLPAGDARLAAGCAARYRFVGGPAAAPSGQSTRWFPVRVAGWRAAPDSAVAVDPGAGLVPGSVEVLDDGERVRRVRFALALAPGEHVAGFGERFDALDHRGA